MALPDFLLPLLDALIPPRRTERLVRTLTLDELRRCRAPVGSRFEAILPYHDPRCLSLVWELKFRRSRRALELAAALMKEALEAVAAEAGVVPLIIPVPMHPQRLAERGFNPCELLTRAATAGSSVLEYAPALTRVRMTRPQQGLPRAERLTNVKGSMLAEERVFGRTCAVVDDVATTGATLEEARRALIQAGARSVVCIALAA